VFEKAGRALDWLQRAQALWSALPETLRTWIKGGLWSAGAAAGTLVVGTISSLDPVHIWLLAVVAGTTAAVGYAAWHNLRPPASISENRDASVVTAITPSVPRRQTLTVRAVQKGVYGSVKRSLGDVFTLKKESHFARGWMEWVETPSISLQDELLPTNIDEGLGTRAKADHSMPPLNIELALKRNEHGTPGLILMARNNDADTVPDTVVTVFDIRRWEEAVQRFVMTEDIYEHGTTFTEIRIGKATLHPVKQTQIAFLRAENRKVVVQKEPGLADDSNRNHYPIKTAGVWRIGCRVHSPDGRSLDRFVCFSWDGSDASCIPCNCPPHPIITSAPRPPGIR
jgi:hypothetical protein